MRATIPSQEVEREIEEITYLLSADYGEDFAGATCLLQCYRDRRHVWNLTVPTAAAAEIWELFQTLPRAEVMLLLEGHVTEARIAAAL